MKENNECTPDASGTLWCVHVYGPDDLLPMRDKTSALEEANALNAAILSKRHNDGNDPLCVAVVEPYPYSAESHVDGTKNGAGV